MEHLNNEIKFKAVLRLLNEVEKQIKAHITEYKGTEKFMPALFKTIFSDKKIKIKKGKEGENSETSFVKDKEWYVYDAHYGTSEEKDFVDLMSRVIGEFKKQYKEIYLVRNERQLKIYNFQNGQGFEPDYLLFLIKKNGESVTYQLFIEPKGLHLVEHDAWKKKFLEEIRLKFKDTFLELKKGNKYRIIGAPFYTSENENEFKEKLMEIVGK